MCLNRDNILYLHQRCICKKNKMFKKIKKHSHLLHKTGMTLSVLCLIHCLSMPFIVTLLPIVTKGFFNHTFEIILVISSLVLAIILLIKDYKIHHQTLPLKLLVGAAILQYIGLFIVHEKLESAFVIMGSFLMAYAYINNWNMHQKTCSNHKH
jgi:hypothetical protein